MQQLLTVTVTGPGAEGVTTRLDDGHLTITLPQPAAPGRAPMRVGYHPTPAEYGTWFGKLPWPWFTRVFNAPGKGLPVLGGAVLNTLAKMGTIPHVSFKDRVPPPVIAAFLSSIPASVPAVWLTWDHEGDIDWAGDVAGYTGYWKLLRATADAHPNRGKVTLVNVHTQYASRMKRQVMDWRQFVLPDAADVDGWDCYRPADTDVYEAPETLLGLAVAAQREFGVRLHITEYGTHPASWDTDGAAQAAWYAESFGVMAAAGVEAVGLWCNIDGGREYRPTKPKVFQQWVTLLRQYNGAEVPRSADRPPPTHLDSPRNRQTGHQSI
jgi:hypothetical protein